MRGPLVLLAVAVTSAPAPAEADVFKLFAEAHGGGMLGKGTGGDIVDNAATGLDEAFFEGAPPGAYGALIGAQFLFLALEIQHHQFTDGDELATWTQFGAGMRFEIPLGQRTAEQKKAGKGGFAELGVLAAFGLGTGRQVEPPLSNDEVTDKAFLLQGRIGFGTHLNKVLDLGIMIPVSAGYFFKSGGSAVANDLSTHYQGVQAEALIVLRGNIRLF